MLLAITVIVSYGEGKSTGIIYTNARLGVTGGANWSLLGMIRYRIGIRVAHYTGGIYDGFHV